MDGIMQLTGPQKVVFPDGNGQQPVAISATGSTGTVTYTVTEIPAQVVAIRKTAAAAALSVGAALTAAEAAALVATRATSASLGPSIGRGVITGVRTRVYATGAAAPAFSVGTAADVSAVQNGNFWIPNFPGSGSGTLTIEIIFDTGVAITLGNISDFLMQLDYTNTTNPSWANVISKAITSTDGNTISVLNSLSGTPDGVNSYSNNHFAGNVSGANSARWFGVQLTLVPIRYPMIFLNIDINAASSGAYAMLPNPVYVGLQAKDGTGGANFTQSAIKGVRTRAYATGGTAPAFNVGSAADVTSATNGNFWIPNFPPSGSGTATVDILFDYGTAVTISSISDILLQLDYSNTATQAWQGVVAKFITSTDGTALTVLNALSGLPDTVIPNAQRHYSGSVIGASSARWFGVQLTLVPRRYPLIFYGLSGSTLGASTANIRIPIGDTSTNFGTTPSTLSITGGPIVRLGTTELVKTLGISVSGGTAPYAISVDSTGMTNPLTLAKTAASAALSGNATTLTLAEMQALVAKRSTHTEYTPGASIDYLQSVSIRTERNGSLALLGTAELSAFKNRNFYGQSGGASTLSSGFLVEMPAAVQIGSISNIALRYGYGETLPAGATVEFFTSPDGVAVAVIATVPLPAKGSDGNYTVSSVIAGAASTKFWGLRFKFTTSTNSSGVGLYNGPDPVITTPATPYQTPDIIGGASTCVVKVTDSAGTIKSLTLKIGGAETVIVEAPTAAEPAIVELQEFAGSTWVSRGTLQLTGRIGDINPDSGMKFEGTVGSVWVSDPSTTLPIIGNFEAWGVRFGWGASNARKFSYCFGLKPTNTTWPNYPFGEIKISGRQTVPSQLHRWIVKTTSGAVVEVLDWNGGPINDPAKSPKQFWATGAAGDLISPAYRPYHIGQGVMGWFTEPTIRSTAQSIFPKLDAPLEWTFRDPGIVNPQDYTIGIYQISGLFNIYSMDADGIATLQGNWTSEDPEMIVGSSRHSSTTAFGYRYRAGQTSGRDVTTGPGGVRVLDRTMFGDPFAQVLQNPSSVRLHRNTSWASIAREVSKSYISENCFHIVNARFPKPLPMTPGGEPSHVRSYYVGGDLNDPQSLDLNSGRADAINGGNDVPARNGQYALSKTDPSGWLSWTGQVPDYEHNYPFAALGALVFESPAHWWMAQFHFLQSSMVLNREGYLASSTKGSWTTRPHAWPFANAAYLWAIQDSNHPMAVIGRAQLEAKLKAELIAIADVEIPYFSGDPANVDSIDDYNRALLKRFGGIGSSQAKIGGPTLLPLGYLCQGLSLWKKFGLWDRMRSLDTRCATALDYLLSRIAVATVDLLLDAPYVLAQQHDNYGSSAYNPIVWPVTGTGVTPSSLPQNWAAWAALNPANGSTFWEGAPGQFYYGIGQYHVLHCVTSLKRVFGFAYPRIDQAETLARQLMATRIAAVRALPVGQKAAHLPHMQICQGLISISETGTVTTF
jgi:hypothetical protein